MHRLMMTSTAYRQSSDWPAGQSPGAKVDPENRLLWHMNLRRLEAEILRDAILAASGKLDRHMGGPPVEGPLLADGLKEFQNLFDEATQLSPAESIGMWRRSVYVLARRYFPLAFLETFDAPILQTNCNRRVNSVSPLQSLTLMNDDFVVENARAFADRVSSLSPGKPVQDTIATAYLLALSRRPSEAELQIARSHLDREEELYLKANASDEQARRAALESFCHLLFLTNEFLYNN